MLNKVHEILKDPDCAGNIRCFTWAFICVMVYFSVFLYGFGINDLQFKIEDITQNMEVRINNAIEAKILELGKQMKNHRHKMFSGKVVFMEQNKSDKKP